MSGADCPAGTGPVFDAPGPCPAPAACDFLAALLAGDRRGALCVARAVLEQGMAPIDLYADVIQWAQRDIGRRWVAGEVSVADEHVATAISQYVVSAVYDELELHPARAQSAVIAGVTGDRHQLGAQMVADALEADGWSVRFLGADVPVVDVVAMVDSLRPRLVGISATMLQSLAVASELIEGVRSVDAGIAVIVGGRAFAACDDAWRELGADAESLDVRSAVRTAARFAA